jgi:transcription antitermination factor NusG
VIRQAGRIYVVVVSAQCEQLVRWDLEDAGFVAYTPIARHWRRLATRKVEVLTPVMPGYLFVWSTDIRADFAAIRRTRRVIGILGRDGRPQACEADLVAGLLMTEVCGHFDWTTTTKPKMTLRQRVKIIGGMWQGREGVVVKLMDEAGTDLRVHIDGAGAMGDVRVKSDKLEVILTPHANQLKRA